MISTSHNLSIVFVRRSAASALSQLWTVPLLTSIAWAHSFCVVLFSSLACQICCPKVDGKDGEARRG